MAEAYEKAEKLRKAAQNRADNRAEQYEEIRAENARLASERTDRVRTVYREIGVPAADCEPDHRAIELLQGSIDHANSILAGEP